MHCYYCFYYSAAAAATTTTATSTKNVRSGTQFSVSFLTLPTEFRSVQYGRSCFRDGEHAQSTDGPGEFSYVSGHLRWKIGSSYGPWTTGSPATVLHYFSGIEPTNSEFRTTNSEISVRRPTVVVARNKVTNWVRSWSRMNPDKLNRQSTT